MDGARVGVLARRILEGAGHFPVSRTDDGAMVIGPGFRIGSGSEPNVAHISHMIPARSTALDSAAFYYIKLAAVASYALPFIAKDWQVDLTSPGVRGDSPFGPQITVTHPDGISRSRKD